MTYDLTRLGIEKDLQYECITTTISKDGVKNAGAFTFIYLGDDRVHCHIFEGSKTLKNILDTSEYVVNITQDPLVFTYATLNCLSDEYYTTDSDIAIVKNTPAYIIVDVENVEIKTPENFPIKSDNRIYFIYGKIRKVGKTLFPQMLLISKALKVNIFQAARLILTVLQSFSQSF